MNDNGYYFFELDEKNYLYDFAAGIIAEITPYFMEILTKYNENKICEKTEQELIDSLLSCGLLQKIESTPKPYHLPLRINVILDVAIALVIMEMHIKEKNENLRRKR